VVLLVALTAAACSSGSGSGAATPTEVRKLVEDGVPVAPLPPSAPKKTEVN
jgi:hypothetical protein